MDTHNDKGILLFWKTYKATLNAILLVSLTGLVYIYPFHTDFRFTISVAVLSSLLLYFHLPVFLTAVGGGIMIVILRSILDLLGGNAWNAVVQHNLPTLGYYVAFGWGFFILRIRTYTNKVPNLLLLLISIDVLSNCIELFLRGELEAANFAAVLGSIMSVALVRSIIAMLGYYALKQYHSFVLAEDCLSRYAELLLLTAQLKAELFFLKKSSWDIERVMEKGYLLYKKLLETPWDDPASPDSFSSQALAVSRDIHEIKKDYQRVISGIEDVLKLQPFETGMRLSEMFILLEQSTLRYLKSTGKTVELSFKYNEDFVTDKYYTLVALLDNLIMNAIDACSTNGKISITQRRAGSRMIFEVEDNGCGIKQEDLAYVFHAGYSTKFCVRTGKMSTGIGLTHVKNLVEALDGEITVDSQLLRYTRFSITLPIEKLLKN